MVYLVSHFIVFLGIIGNIDVGTISRNTTIKTDC